VGGSGGGVFTVVAFGLSSCLKSRKLTALYLEVEKALRERKFDRRDGGVEERAIAEVDVEVF